MKLCKDYPIYVNPTFDEIVEMAHSHWDTMRILVTNDILDRNRHDFAIGSGYGNTHHSLVLGYRKYRGKKHFSSDTYILYHENGRVYMNLEDVGRSARASFSAWPLDQEHLALLRDLVRESGLVL